MEPGTSHQSRPPILILANFYTQLIDWCQKNTPSIPITRDSLATKYDELATLAPCLEDLSPIILDTSSFSASASQVGELISQCPDPIKGQLSQILLDVVVLACLVPYAFISAPKQYYSIFEYERPISRFAIRPVTPSQCEAILKQLSGIVAFNDHGALTFDLSASSLISHINMEAYSAANLLQRMFLLSLSHLSLPLRNDVLSRNNSARRLMERIRASKYLHYWMLSCSSCDEQYFLNTCDTAASLSSIVSYHACIASLIQLGRLICDEVEKRCHLASDKDPAFPCFFGSVPSQLSFSTAIIAQVRESMDNIESMAWKTLEQEEETHSDLSPTSTDICSHRHSRAQLNGSVVDIDMILERHEIMRKWHKEVQRLSGIFLPDDPVVLTEKTFLNDWHKSAKLQTMWALVDQFRPGRPTFLSRSEASRTLEQIDCHYHHTQVALLEPEADGGIWLDFPWNVADEPDLEARRKIVTKLWERTLYHDGLLISSRENLFFGLWTIGHLSYWKAVWLGSSPEDRYFLISDPELQYFKILSIAQAEKFISDKEALVNPTDGAIVQHFRARSLREAFSS